MNVVAIGGGHGTAVVVRAATSLRHHVTAVVSVGDDGGSSGKLRKSFDIPAVGDIRRCIGASSPPMSEHLLEYRVGEDGHPIGNLLLVSAIKECKGDLESAAAMVASLVGASATVLPATNTAIDIVAEAGGETVVGQSAIHRRTDVSRLRVFPHNAVTTPAVVSAIENADFIALGPGSHFTSVLAALVVPGIAEAVASSSARLLWIANLPTTEAESRNFTVKTALQSIRDHGAFPDVAILDDSEDCELSEIHVVRGPLASSDRQTHSVSEMSRVLQKVMAD